MEQGQLGIHAADGVLMPSFLQIGRGYTSSELPPEIMDYVYSFHARYVEHPDDVQTPGRIDLMRVPKRRIGHRGEYEFFSGTDFTGAPIWSKDLKQRVAVLEKPHVLDAPPTVAWNPHLRQFIMAMGHVPEDETTERGVGFYEARQPWGPSSGIQGDRPVRGGHDLLLPIPDQMDECRSVRLDGVHRTGQTWRPGMGRLGRRQGPVRAG